MRVHNKATRLRVEELAQDKSNRRRVTRGNDLIIWDAGRQDGCIIPNAAPDLYYPSVAAVRYAYGRDRGAIETGNAPEIEALAEMAGLVTD